MIALILSLLPFAYAQTVSGGDVPILNAQTFQASMDSNVYTRLVDSNLNSDALGGRGVLSYSANPLEYTTWDGTTEPLVGGIFQLDAIGTYTRGPLRIGLGVPVILRSVGGAIPDVTALGDLSVEGKWRALNPDDAPVGLSFVLQTALPTSTGGAAFSSGGLGMGGMVAVDQNITEQLSFAFNAGVSARPSVTLEDVVWGPTGVVQLGGAYALSENAGVTTEFVGSGVLNNLANPLARPAELLLGGWFRPQSSGAIIRPAVAFGLSDAITTPAARFIVSVAWAPDAPTDLNEEPIVDLGQVTVQIVDTDDVPMPNATWTAGAATGTHGDSASFAAGETLFETTGGSIALTVTGGGEQEVIIRVPAPRGLLKIIAQDESGQPIPTAHWTATGPLDTSGTANAVLEVRPGAYNITVSAEGYRSVNQELEVVQGDDTAVITLTLVPARAELASGRIDIKDSVFFETSKAVIRDVSFPLLEEVAEILAAHPEVLSMRVEGHTDSQGSATDNLALSQARAEAVVVFLVDLGIDLERLSAVGHGEEQPLVEEKSAEDRAKNRRVTFSVAERSDTEGQIERIELEH